MASWVKTSAPSNLYWNSIASSSDGKKIVAVAGGDYIYTSINSGLTWTKQAISFGTVGWSAVSSSSDGTNLVAHRGDYYLCNSTDSGVTWTARFLTSGSSSTNAIKSSSSGQYVYVAVYRVGIYSSTDYGANWTKTSAPSSDWTAIACNSTGTFIVAAASYSNIYTSSDSGATWIQRTGSQSGVNWYGIACSSDGSKIVAAVFGGFIYTSTNYGVNWTQTSAPSFNWRSIACSSDFSRIFAVTERTDGYIYFSNNSGNTWIQQSSSGPGGPGLSWYCISTSSDGYNSIAGLPPITGSYSGIYTYNEIIPPCFKEGTMILTIHGYKLVQNLRKGDLVKTISHEYKAIEMIGKKEYIHNPTTEKRIKEQLYVCSNTDFGEVFEPLVITGCHSILVDEFVSEEQRQKTIEVNGDIYITDDKYRLPACAHHLTTVYETPGTYTIYHLALENKDYFMNYGIYANGLLVESCSRRYLKERSDMELIE